MGLAGDFEQPWVSHLRVHPVAGARFSYVTTQYRSEIPLRDGHATRLVPLVRLRRLEEPAVLRRHAQGKPVHASQGRHRGGGKIQVVRLQAHEDPTVLRRKPQRTTGLVGISDRVTNKKGSRQGFQARLLVDQSESFGVSSDRVLTRPNRGRSHSTHLVLRAPVPPWLEAKPMRGSHRPSARRRSFPVQL